MTTILANIKDNILNQMTITCDIVIGETNLSLETLQSLKPNDTLPLDLPLDGKVFLRINNESIATGFLVNVNGFYGINIDDIQ